MEEYFDSEPTTNEIQSNAASLLNMEDERESANPADDVGALLEGASEDVDELLNQATDEVNVAVPTAPVASGNMTFTSSSASKLSESSVIRQSSRGMGNKKTQKDRNVDVVSQPSKERTLGDMPDAMESHTQLDDILQSAAMDTLGDTSDSKGKSVYFDNVLQSSTQDTLGDVSNEMDSILQSAARETLGGASNDFDAILQSAARETLGNASDDFDSILQSAARETLDDASYESNEMDNVLQSAAREVLGETSTSRREEELLAEYRDQLQAVAMSSKTLVDFRKGFTMKSFLSKTAQALDEAYFRSLIIRISPMEMNLITSSNPLLNVIMKGDPIDVQMFVDGLGPSAPSEVMKRNSGGRNALHFAVLSKSKSGHEVLRVLLRTFRSQTTRDLALRLQRLEQEKATSMGALEKALAIKSAGSSGMRQKRNKEKVAAVENWFKREDHRLHRQAEFRIEAWWIRAVTSADNEDRAVVHYAVSGGCSKDMLFVLFTKGRAEFYVKPAKERAFVVAQSKNIKIPRQRSFPVTKIEPPLFPYFQSDALYDTLTGEMVANVESLSGTAWDLTAKKADSDEARKVSDASRSWLGDTLSLRTQLGKSEATPHVDVVEYEVIVPWVLRNILRRTTDIGTELGASGVEVLEELLEQRDPRGDGLLLLSEFEELLRYLGVRVTGDVAREICFQYPCEVGALEDKTDWLNKKRSRTTTRKAPSKSSRSKKIDSTKPEKRGSKGGRGGDGDDGRKKRSSKSSKQLSKRSTVDSSDSEDVYNNNNDDDASSDELDLFGSDSFEFKYDIDGSVGLDKSVFLQAIRSGKGLRTMALHDRKHAKSDPSSLTMTDDLGLYFEIKIDPNTEVITRRVASHTNQEKRPELSHTTTIGSILLNRRYIVDYADSYGRSPLIIASALGNWQLVQLLLAFRADISVTSADGHTALSVARNLSVSRLLQQGLIKWLKTKKATTNTIGEMRNSREVEKQKFLLSTAESIDWEDPTRELMLQTILKESTLRTKGKRFDTVTMSSQLLQLPKNLWKNVRPAISWAISSGLLDVVGYLLSTGEDPNGMDAFGRRPLNMAIDLVKCGDNPDAVCSSPAIVEALLSAGAKVQLKLLDGATALHYIFGSPPRTAPLNNTLESIPRTHKSSKFVGESVSIPRSIRTRLLRLVTRLILQWGGNPNDCDDGGSTAVHKCVRNDDLVGCLVELLRHGANPFLCNRSGRSPLHNACQSGSWKCINVLCRWDSDCLPKRLYGERGKDLISLVSKDGKTAKQLLPNDCNSNCFNTIWSCCRDGNEARLRDVLNEIRMGKNALWESVEELTTSMAQISLRQSSTAFLTFRDLDEHEELWLMNGLDAKSRRARWTPIHACIIGWAEKSVECNAGSGSATVKKILGITLAAEGRTKKLSLNKSNDFVNVARSYSSVLRVLLENHAYPDGLDCGCRTPLMLAAALGIDEAVKVLMNAGADLNVADLRGNTAIHYAYAFGNVSIASLLEAHGADSEVQNVGGMAAVDIIGKHQNKDFSPLIRYDDKESRPKSSKIVEDLLLASADEVLQSRDRYKSAFTHSVDSALNEAAEEYMKDQDTDAILAEAAYDAESREDAILAQAAEDAANDALLAEAADDAFG